MTKYEKIIEAKNIAYAELREQCIQAEINLRDLELKNEKLRTEVWLNNANKAAQIYQEHLDKTFQIEVEQAKKEQAHWRVMEEIMRGKFPRTE